MAARLGHHAWLNTIWVLLILVFTVHQPHRFELLGAGIRELLGCHEARELRGVDTAAAIFPGEEAEVAL